MTANRASCAAFEAPCQIQLSNSHVFHRQAPSGLASGDPPEFSVASFDLLPRAEGAERRNGACVSVARSCEERAPALRGPARLTALHRGVLSGGAPLPAGHLRLAGVRDNFPGLRSQPGGLVSTVSRDHDCESWARAPLPIHAQFRSAERPSANGDTSAILTRPGSVKHY